MSPARKRKNRLARRRRMNQEKARRENMERKLFRNIFPPKRPIPTNEKTLKDVTPVLKVNL